MTTQAALKTNSTMKSAMGLAELNPAIFLKVAMAKNPVRRKMAKEEIRRDWR